jgi:hypothetical protein
MLRFICVQVVKFAAVVVCIGVCSACLFPGHDARYEDRRDSREAHHDEHREDHH